MSAIATAIRRIVAQIPQGKVATYGQIARLAGYPRHARFVGQCLHDTPVPWQRVINGQGKVSPEGWMAMTTNSAFYYSAKELNLGTMGKLI